MSLNGGWGLIGIYFLQKTISGVDTSILYKASFPRREINLSKGKNNDDIECAELYSNKSADGTIGIRELFGWK